MVAGALDTILIPSLRLEEILSDGSTLTNPAADSRRLFLGEDGLFHLKDSAGTVTDIGSPGQPLGLTGAVSATRYVGGTASVAPTTGTFAVGDFVITQAGGIYICTVAGSPGTWVAGSGSGVGTGAAGAVLAMGNSAVIWNAGTSFPASKATNDRYWRSDLGLEFYWDGTRWLSTTLYTQQLTAFLAALDQTSGAQTIGRASVWSGDYDVWMIDMRWSSFVNTTNSGTQFWTLTLTKRDGASSTTVVAPTTAADAANVYVTHTTAIGAALGVANDILTMTAGPTSAPGQLNLTAMLTYRLIGT